jgi:hypothetical protein
MAIIAMTTSNSMRVNPRRVGGKRRCGDSR